jgi:LacI family transcriptional regulator
VRHITVNSSEYPYLMTRNARRKPTIHDVAMRAGVSITTVSHALSGARPVHPETAATIWRVVDELGYRPSRLAAQLRRGTTGNIGFVLPDMGNESFTAVARAIHDAALAADFQLLIRNSDESVAEEANAVRSFLREQAVDGVLLIATHGDHTYLHELLDNGARIVATNRPVSDLAIPSVTRDDEGSAYLATRHLLTLGHRRIAALAGRRDLLSSQLRLAGIQRALAEAALPAPVIRYSDWSPGDDPHLDGRRATIEVLRQAEPPTAIIALSQRHLEGAVLAFRDLGVRCPDDVALVSYGRTRLAAVMHPVPTVIDQDATAFGQTATHHLLEWLRTGIEPESVVLPPIYALGDSCGWRRFAPVGARSVFAPDVPGVPQYAVSG